MYICKSLLIAPHCYMHSRYFLYTLHYRLLEAVTEGAELINGLAYSVLYLLVLQGLVI